MKIVNRYQYFEMARKNINNLNFRLAEWSKSSRTAESLKEEFDRELSEAGYTVELPNSGVIKYMASMIGLKAKKTIFGTKHYGEAKATRSHKLKSK